MSGERLQISSDFLRQFLSAKTVECRIERCLRILAAREPADVIVELLAALVGEMEHQEPRRALEGVALLSRQEHGLARRQPEHTEVVRLRMVAKVLESI